MPQAWLRGPIPGIADQLLPVAHSLIMAREDIDHAVTGLTPDQLWLQPGGVASIGFHIAHLSGSTDRLLTYARDEGLSDVQMAALDAERNVAERRPSLDSLLLAWHDTVDQSLAQLAATDSTTLADARAVGRARLPSTVLGLLFHAAEHAARHAGQVVTTARLVQPLTTDAPPA